MSNAQKAKSWPKSFAFAYSVGDHPTIVWKTAVTLGFAKGDAVIQSGLDVTLALSSSAALYGIAGADAAIGDTVPIFVGDRNNVFIGQVTAANISAVAFPIECDIEGATGVMTINHDLSTEDVVYVIETVKEDDLTDTTDGARVYFQILRSTYDLLVAGR